MLGFLRDTKEGMDVYVMPAAGGAERRLTSDNRDLGGQRSVWLVGLTFTSDGHDIIVGGNGLWRVHTTGDAKRAEPIRGLGFTAFNPYIRGNRLVYGAPQRDANVYLLPLRSETDAGEPTKLIASTFVDADAQLSPDGRHIVFSSDRTGADEIWKANSDGSDPMQLTFSVCLLRNPAVVTKRARDRLQRGNCMVMTTYSLFLRMADSRDKSQPIRAIRLHRTTPATASGSILLLTKTVPGTSGRWRLRTGLRPR